MKLNEMKTVAQVLKRQTKIARLVPSLGLCIKIAYELECFLIQLEPQPCLLFSCKVVFYTFILIVFTSTTVMAKYID